MTGAEKEFEKPLAGWHPSSVMIISTKIRLSQRKDGFERIGSAVILVSLSELSGMKSSILFGAFALLECWDSRPCEEPRDGGRVDSK